MNHIYWDIDKISMLTDCMSASSHKHGMIQFFLCLEEQLEIKVAGEKMKCSCIVVNKNVRHSFKTYGKRHLTVVYEPVSEIGVQISRILDGRDYFIVSENDARFLKKAAQPMIDSIDQKTYYDFVMTMYECFGIEPEEKDLMREL